MRYTTPACAKQFPSRFFVKYHPRPIKAYHLRLPSPIRWTYARDLQNSIIKAYQAHHHNIVRRPLPPTLVTLQFKPVFTYGRDPRERPSQRERLMLEGLPGGDGLVTETRMAWARERGWRYHGPGQVHFWMVADLEDWNWELQDVKKMMNSSLTAMLQYYLPSRGTQMQSAIAMPFTQPHIPLSPLSLESTPSSKLTTLELHENSFKIISYGCSLNITPDQSIGTARLSRYGFPCPDTTSLSEQGWVNQEPLSMIHDRFVSEMSQRIGTIPEDVDIPFLARKFKAEIPERDSAVDKVKRRHPDAVTPEDIVHSIRLAKTQSTGNGVEEVKKRTKWTPRLQFNAVSLKKEEDVLLEDDPMLVPSWGQYVRVAWQNRRLGQPSKASGQSTPKTGVRSGIQRAGSEISKIAAKQTSDEGPPSKVLEQTIQWSTSAEIVFTPHLVETKEVRRTVVSPRELQDDEYLGDLLTDAKTDPVLWGTARMDASRGDGISMTVSSDNPEEIILEETKTEDTLRPSGAENKALKEQQKRVMQRLRASGEDRI